jgi:hypothetical protein
MNLEPSHLVGSLWKSSDAFMQLNDSTNPTRPSPRRRYRTTDEIPRSPKSTSFLHPLDYSVLGFRTHDRGERVAAENVKKQNTMLDAREHRLFFSLPTPVSVWMRRPR